MVPKKVWLVGKYFGRVASWSSINSHSYLPIYVPICMKIGVYPRTNCCSVTKVLMLPDDKEKEEEEKTTLLSPKRPRMTGDPCLVGQNTIPSAWLCCSTRPSSWERQTSERASKRANKSGWMKLIAYYQPGKQWLPKMLGLQGSFFLLCPPQFPS